MRLVSALRGFLTMSDYDDARDVATMDIVSRFSRGNVSVQNGQIFDERDMEVMSARGDHALAKLNRLARRSKRA